MMRRVTSLIGPLAGILLTVGCGSQGDRPAATTDQARAALEEGNRLFFAGQIEDAITAYLKGVSTPRPDPTLLYNLGTALHHAGRLPEAILWYRRAAGTDPQSPPVLVPNIESSSDDKSRFQRLSDPWLAENLWLARRSLGSQILQPSGSMAGLVRHTASLRSVAIVLAWITLLLVIAGQRVPGALVVASAALAILTFCGAAAIERWGPQPAVMVGDCVTPAGELIAGTEIWVRPDADGWKISGTADMSCPAGTVGLVFPLQSAS